MICPLVAIVTSAGSRHFHAGFILQTHFFYTVFWLILLSKHSNLDPVMSFLAQSSSFHLARWSVCCIFLKDIIQNNPFTQLTDFSWIHFSGFSKRALEAPPFSFPTPSSNRVCSNHWSLTSSGTPATRHSAPNLWDVSSPCVGCRHMDEDDELQQDILTTTEDFLMQADDNLHVCQQKNTNL